eukprot:scaffold41187_cov303-Isochrysis_galbana.AAC.4
MSRRALDRAAKRSERCRTRVAQVVGSRRTSRRPLGAAGVEIDRQRTLSPLSQSVTDVPNDCDESRPTQQRIGACRTPRPGSK